MDDYEGYILPQAVNHIAWTSAVRETTEWSREREGFAEMTPFTERPFQHTRHSAEFMEMSPSYIGAGAPVYVSMPWPHQGPPSVMDVLQQLQEDNRRLQLMVMDMKHQMDRIGVAPAPLSLQSARPEHPQESHLPTTKEDVKPSLPPPSMLHAPPGPLYNAGHPCTREEDIWPPSPPPWQPALQQQPRELHRLPAAQEKDILDDEWPLPPPPVAFYSDIQEPPQVQPAPLVKPSGLVEELREHLEQLEARLSPAPSMLSDTAQYESVPRSVITPQHLPGKLSAEADPFSPQLGLTSSVPLPSSTERTYRGPTPSIPKFTRDDPREFARLRLALDNILPADGVVQVSSAL